MDTTVPPTMTAIVCPVSGGPENLQLSRDTPTPQAKAGEILIRVAATSVNPVDYKAMTGYMSFLGPKLPFIVCKDVAGTVVALGSGVTEFAVGDEVYVDTGRSAFSAAAEYVVVPANTAAKKPTNLSFGEAASLPVVASTSYMAIYEVAGLAEGQRLLIIGGATATGMYGIQFARVRGIHVTVTGSASKADKLKELGAEEVIDYRTEDWSVKLRGGNFDVVYDCIGEATAFDQSANVLRPGGLFLTITSQASVTAGAIAMQVGSVIGRKVMSWFGGVRFQFLFTEPSTARMNAICALFESGQVRPLIDRVYPLLEIQKAFEHVMSGRAYGKVVVDIAGSLPLAADAALVVVAPTDPHAHAADSRSDPAAAGAVGGGAAAAAGGGGAGASN